MLVSVNFELRHPNNFIWNTERITEMNPTKMVLLVVLTVHLASGNPCLHCETIRGNDICQNRCPNWHKQHPTTLRRQMAPKLITNSSEKQYRSVPCLTVSDLNNGKIPLFQVCDLFKSGHICPTSIKFLNANVLDYVKQCM